MSNSAELTHSISRFRGRFFLNAVVSRNLVWNLEDPEAAYKEWLRVLKPGGKLFVFDGNHYCYLYNAEYASIQPKVDASSNHVLLGIKTNVIDDIARCHLPLSKTSSSSVGLKKFSAD